MTHSVPPFNTQTVRDWVSFQREFDTFWQTYHNGAVEFSLRTTGLLAGSTYYYGFDVPDDRVFVLFSRALTVTEGRYYVDVVTAEDGFTGGTLAYKSTLRSGAPSTVQTDLYGGVTPSGAVTVRTNGMIDTGIGIGAGMAGGASGREGVIKMFSGSSMLRVEQAVGDVTWSSNIDLIAWEIDA